MSALAALAVSLLVVGADKVPEPPSGPNPFLTQAKDLYGKLEFEKCLKRVGQAQQWRSSPRELLEIELYAGLCHFNLGQKPDAEERFKTALRIDPSAELPPYTTPLAVTLFNKIKKSMKPAPEKEKEKPVAEKEKEPERPPPDVIESPPEEKEKPVAEVKKDPAKDKEKDKKDFFDGPDESKSDVPVAKKLTPKKPVEDLVQPAQPSFAEKKAPAIALTSVAVVSLGVGIGLGAASSGSANQARAANFESDFLAKKKEAEGLAVGANISYGVAAAAAVVAVVLWVTGN